MEGPETLTMWVEKRVGIKSREMESKESFHLKLFLHQRWHFPFIPLASQWRQAVKDVVHSGLPSIWSERYFQSSLWLLGTNQSWWQSTWSRASVSIWLLQERPVLSNPSETVEFNSVEVSRPVIFPITDLCFSYYLTRVSLSVCFLLQQIWLVPSWGPHLCSLASLLNYKWLHTLLTCPYCNGILFVFW